MTPERLISTDEDEWIRAEAAEWLVQRTEADLDPAREAAFQSWRLADPRHDRQYAELAALWGGMTEWNELAEMEPLDRPSPRERWVAWRARRARRAEAVGRAKAADREWRGSADFGSLAAAFAVILVLAAGPFLLPLLMDQTPRVERVAQTHETAPGEIRDIALEDGTAVTLGAGSRISVSFGNRRREVALLSGEAYFAVAHNKARPFFVRASGANVRVVGTEFSVSMGEATTRISVADGIVDVSTVGLPGERVGNRGQVRLKAGDGAVAWRNDSSRGLETMRVDQVAGWRSGRLSYQDAYLADILADISRYAPTRFDVASPAIGRLRVTASFRADEAASAVPVILRGLGLSSSETEPGVLEIRRQ